MLEIYEIVDLEWQGPRPQTVKSFPCMLCWGAIATHRLRMTKGAAKINMVACGDCIKLEPVEMLDKIKD